MSKARFFSYGVARAEAFHRAEDDRRIDLSDHVITQTQALDRSGGEVLDHHAGGFPRFLHPLQSPRGSFKFFATDRLFALYCRKCKGSLARWPPTDQPGSPTLGFSILTTSAPSKSRIFRPARQISPLMGLFPFDFGLLRSARLDVETHQTGLRTE
jgi:hypothetical protein